MNIQAPKRMTVDEYLVWALDRPGRYELINGVVREMSPEKVGHTRVKGFAYRALSEAIKRAGVHYVSLPDGPTVRVSKDTAFEPDALVCPAPLADLDSLEIPNPVIVVEVASPSTHKYDSGFKLSGYMSLPSVQHILLVNSVDAQIAHHRRVSDTEFLVTVVSEGTLRLDPPGFEIPVADFFAQD